MPTQTADNEQDSKDIADKAYHDTFDSKGRATADNLASLQSDLDSKYSQAFDAVDNSQGTKDDANLNQTLNDKENASSLPEKFPEGKKETSSFGAKLQRAFKKNGATGGVIGVLIGGFVSSSFFLLPGSLLVAIEKAMTNDASDATRTNIVMRRAYIGGLFSKASCKTAACEKLTKMSDTQKANWEKKGFTIELDAEKNVKSIKFPDGDIVRSAAEYDTKVKNSLSGRLAADKVINVRSAFFQNSKFNKVLEKVGVKKANELKASEEKDKAKRTEEMAKSFDENTHAINDPDPTTRAAKIEEKTRAETIESSKFKASMAKVTDKLGKSNPAQMAISAACATYNVARITTATVKAKYIYDLINFAFPFIQAASQIYYYGSAKPELVEYLADRLTWYDNKKTLPNGEENPKYGLTAMDSQGLQMAIYGDFTKLQEFTAHYTTGALGATIMASNIVKSTQSMVGGKENLHNICVTNSYVGLASSVFCLSNPLSAAVCGVGAAGVIILGPKIAEEAVKQLSAPAIKWIADANLNSSLKGVSAGDALAAGVGLMLMESSMGYGLAMASSTLDVKQFITATDDEYYRYGDELAQYEARSKPFDISNRYSFMGQIASAFNPYRSNDGTIFSQILNGFAVVTSPLTKASTASALYSQPSNMTIQEGSAENRLNKQIVDSSGRVVGTARDLDLEQIGAVNDWSGRPVYITNGTVLGLMAGQATGSNTAIADTIDYMSTYDGGQIDNSGAVIAGSKYEKFKKYCTEEREDPPGTSSESILEGDADEQSWHDGEKCVYKKDRPAGEQKMLDNFAIYFNMCESQYPTAESSIGGDEVSDCAQQVAAKTVSTGAWQIPVSGQCGDGFDPTGSRHRVHKGVDISASAGTPILAPTKMKIVFVGQSPDGTTGNQVTATASDGSGISFRFMHMQSQSPLKEGQEVDAGTEIGKVGSTGNSSGPHLHLDVFPQGVNPMSYSGQVDPVKVFAEHGVTIAGCK